jgi:hypothetical protein
LLSLLSWAWEDRRRATQGHDASFCSFSLLTPQTLTKCSQTIDAQATQSQLRSTLCDRSANVGFAAKRNGGGFSAFRSKFTFTAARPAEIVVEKY